MKKRHQAGFSKGIIAFATLLSSFTAIASDQDIIPVGNALLRPQTIERVIRSVIAESFDGDVNHTRLTLTTRGISEDIPLPKATGDLKQILDTLGISNNMSVYVAPIQAGFSLPESGLKIKIQNQGPSVFDIQASWVVTELKAQTNALSIRVPKGLFDQKFSIVSHPITVGLKPGSNPLTVDASLTATLTAEGTKLKLNSLKTNMSGRGQPEFRIQLGVLTVNNKPLTLQIGSNEHLMTANEPQIRAEIQKLEPSFVESIRKSLTKSLQGKINEIAERIQNTPPFKYSVNTSKLLEPLNINSATRNFLGGIDVDFIFSYIQNVPGQQLFSTQVATQLCFDGQCLKSLVSPSPIGADDLASMSADDDVGVVAYESMLKNFVESKAFQARIQTFYTALGGSPGVDLAKSGIKLYLDPARNSVAAVVNLEIDIKKTVTSHSSFGKRLETWFGDAIEWIFGTGRVVKVPFEINFELVGLQQAADGKQNLVVNTVLPFTRVGPSHKLTFLPTTRCPISECPSNISHLTWVTRPGFYDALYSEFKETISPVIRLPLDRSVKIKGVELSAKSVRITKNHGLLVTGKLRTVSEGKQP